MNVAFVNYTPLVYTVDTPYQAPLGGSESALCYLAEALARRGHKVTLFCRIPKQQIIRGVNHLPDNQIQKKDDWDVLVVQNTPDYARQIKPFLKKKTKLVLWLQHAVDQPAVACLEDKNLVNLYSSLVFVSQWQRQEYLKHFCLDPSRCFILRNAVSPAFLGVFKTGEEICPKKINPPLLVYTSTPFRGLDRLIKIFPKVKKEIPNVRLEIFSSMKVYQQNIKEEMTNYGNLYNLCSKTEGVKLIGSLPQPQLAYRLKPALIFAYPNNFAETSCISVMEAMVAGCYIITSKLGALPETTAVFAKLIDFHLEENKYEREFIQATIDVLKEFNSGNYRRLDEILVRQVYFANQVYNWEKRAEEWEYFLEKMC